MSTPAAGKNSDFSFHNSDYNMDLCYLQKKSPSRGFFVILILKQVQDDVNVIPVQDDVNVIPVQDDLNVIPNLFRNLFILVL